MSEGSGTTEIEQSAHNQRRAMSETVRENPVIGSSEALTPCQTWARWVFLDLCCLI